MVITSELLAALLSLDASQRQAAEQEYRRFSVEQRIEGLLSHIPHHQLATVLLRREIVQLSDVSKLRALITPIFQVYQGTEDCNVAYCLAEICASLEWLDAPSGLDIVQRILRASSSVRLWTAIAERVPKSYAASQAYNELPSVNASIQYLELLVLTAAAVPDYASQLGQQYLGRVLPNLFRDEQVWELMVQASEEAPDLLAGTAALLKAVLDYCIQDSSLLSVRVVANLLNLSNAKSMNLPIQQVLSSTLATCWKAMQTVDDDCEEWAAEPASLQEHSLVDEETAIYAQILLSEIIRLPGALPTVLPVLEQAFCCGDWKIRCAALAALECCVEAVPISFAPHVASSVQAALQVSDNPRVEFQAVRLLGIICETSTIEESMAALILERLARATHSPCSKVAAMACQALVSYSRPADPKIERTVVPYLPDVLQAIVTGPLALDLTDMGRIVVKLRAVGVVACWAEASGPAIASYYPLVVPTLLACAQLSGRHEVLQLAGSSLEAVTIFGQALGETEAHLFASDAQQILNWAVPALQNPTIPVDQLLSACARIASVIGEAYVPYLDKVLPHLLQRANAPDDVEFSEGDIRGLSAGQKVEFDEDAGTESMTIAFPGRGVTKVTINTSKIQEKSQAARAIYEHASALGAHFGPFCEECFKVFIPLVNFKFSGDIRGTAAQTLAVVFEAACSYGTWTRNMNLPNAYLSPLVTAMSKQLVEEDSMDVEVIYALADSLSDVFRMMYLHESDLLGTLAQEDVTTVVKRCMKTMVSCLERRSQIFHTLSQGLLSGEDERSELDALLRNEEALLTPLVDSVGYTLKTHRQRFVPIFEAEVVPVLQPYLGSRNDIRARLAAVCLFDDSVEHCGDAAAARYAPMLIEGILRGIDDSTNGGDTELKRAAIYGIAQIARHAPSDVLSDHARLLTQELCRLTSVAKEQSADVAVYENAVSALAALVLFDGAPFRSSGFVKRPTILETFLRSLPLREDEDEARICHSGLCDLIESSAIDVVTERGRLEGIIRNVLALVEEGEEIAMNETCVRMQSILLRLPGYEPANASGQAFGFAYIVSP